LPEVLAGRGTDADREMIDEWIDHSFSTAVADIDSDTQHYGRSTFDSQSTHTARTDALIQRMQELAIRAGEANYKPIAERIMRGINSVNEARARFKKVKDDRAAEDARFQKMMAEQRENWDTAFRKGWITQDGSYTPKYYDENPFVQRPAWMQPQTGTGGGSNDTFKLVLPYTHNPTPSFTPGLLLPGSSPGSSPGGTFPLIQPPTGMGRRPGSEWGGSAVPFGFTPQDGTGTMFPGLVPPSSGIGGFGSFGNTRPDSILPYLQRGSRDDIVNID
jgi:hypothetical protein